MWCKNYTDVSSNDYIGTSLVALNHVNNKNYLYLSKLVCFLIDVIKGTTFWLYT